LPLLCSPENLAANLLDHSLTSEAESDCIRIAPFPSVMETPDLGDSDVLIANQSKYSLLLRVKYRRPSLTTQNFMGGED
jgi:hypothetical protein